MRKPEFVIYKSGLAVTIEPLKSIKQNSLEPYIMQRILTLVLGALESGLQPGVGAKRGGAPLNKNSPPPKLPSMPSKTPFTIAAVQDGGFFY